VSFAGLAQQLLQPVLAVGERVQVYRNLHHGQGPLHFWSVRSTRSGRVLGVLAYVEIADAELRVQEGARQRAVETHRRSVHAYAVGTLAAWDVDQVPPRPRGLVEVTYNPYRAGYFHVAKPSAPTPVYVARRAWFDRQGAWMDARSLR